MPVGSGIRTDGPAANLSAAVHQPESRVAIVVAPDDVGHAVGVEVRRILYVPGSLVPALTWPVMVVPSMTRCVAARVR